MVKYVYTLGTSGERIKVEELDRTVEYTYDSLYRLTSETITKGKTKTTYTYAYDNVSNRTLKTVNGVETVYTYNSLNQLVSENNTTYDYDNAGNLVRVVGVGKTAIYSYNSENKLIKATVQQGNNVVVETYTYDYAGNRTSKTTKTNGKSPVKVKYLNDNSSLTNVLVEISNDGEVTYTVGADLISQEIDGEVYVYLYDGHGTVRALANSKGKVTDTYCYDAFGNLISSTGATENSYLYCGEQFDSTTGLYYLRARYMDTSTGRFISQDSYAGSTADPISLHRYLYANSNPVTYTDPSGYYSDTMAASAGMAIVGQTVQLNAVGIFNSIMAGLAVALTPVVGNLITQYLLLQIDNIASGNTTSAEVNIIAMVKMLVETIMTALSPGSVVEIIPIPDADMWVETIPIPKSDLWTETIPIPEVDPWIETIPIPEADIWIEIIPNPLGKGITILYGKVVPSTGDWRETGMTSNQWYSENGYKATNKRSGVHFGEYNYDLVDGNGNIVGKVHQGHKVNGKVTPKHAHLNDDSTNIHYWFTD